MVRLVFRPYTQFRRSICTSESLRTSIRVSPDFVLTRHSSPSFGSQRVRSWCASPRDENETPRECGATAGAERPSSLGPREAGLHFHCAFRFSRVPMTRAHARLLGPCFKTGPESTQSYGVADRRFDWVCPRASQRTAAAARDRHRVRSPERTARLPRVGRELKSRPSAVCVPSSEPAGNTAGLGGGRASVAAESPPRALDRRPTDRDVLLGEKCTRSSPSRATRGAVGPGTVRRADVGLRERAANESPRSTFRVSQVYP